MAECENCNAPWEPENVWVFGELDPTGGLKLTLAHYCHACKQSHWILDSQYWQPEAERKRNHRALLEVIIKLHIDSFDMTGGHCLQGKNVYMCSPPEFEQMPAFMEKLKSNTIEYTFESPLFFEAVDEDTLLIKFLEDEGAPPILFEHKRGGGLAPFEEVEIKVK